MKRWQCAVVVWALSTLAAPLPVAAAAETGPATKNATETIVAESDDIRALDYFRILMEQGANPPAAPITTSSTAT